MKLGGCRVEPLRTAVNYLSLIGNKGGMGSPIKPTLFLRLVKMNKIGRGGEEVGNPRPYIIS